MRSISHGSLPRGWNGRPRPHAVEIRMYCDETTHGPLFSVEVVDRVAAAKDEVLGWGNGVDLVRIGILAQVGRLFVSQGQKDTRFGGVIGELVHAAGPGGAGDEVPLTDG